MLTWFEIDCEEKGLMSPLSVEPMLKRLFVLTPVHKEVISERLRLYNGPFQQGEPPRKKPPRKGRGTTLK
jgi:hypothetical protein